MLILCFHCDRQNSRTDRLTHSKRHDLITNSHFKSGRDLSIPRVCNLLTSTFKSITICVPCINLQPCSARQVGRGRSKWSPVRTLASRLFSLSMQGFRGNTRITPFVSGIFMVFIWFTAVCESLHVLCALSASFEMEHAWNCCWVARYVGFYSSIWSGNVQRCYIGFNFDFFLSCLQNRIHLFARDTSTTWSTSDFSRAG
jgi:hypothetical protein